MEHLAKRICKAGGAERLELLGEAGAILGAGERWALAETLLERALRPDETKKRGDSELVGWVRACGWIRDEEDIRYRITTRFARVSSMCAGAEFLDWLLSLGVEIDIHTGGSLVFFNAVRFGDLGIAEWFLRQPGGEDINFGQDDDQTFYQVAGDRQTQAARLIRDAYPADYPKTELYWAAREELRLSELQDACFAADEVLAASLCRKPGELWIEYLGGINGLAAAECTARYCSRENLGVHELVAELRWSGLRAGWVEAVVRTFRRE